MRRMLSAALSSFGLKVEEAESGEEAEQKAERPDAFDLIALDWKLPNKSGVEALKGLRQRGITAPALIITAYGRAEVEKDLVRHFPPSTQLDVSILEKPVSAKLLRERILTAFGRALEQFPASAELSASDILLRGVRILLVEDNPINQQVATGLLETLGVETTVASSGEEAMEILATRQFDAIMMDMQMPGKDGLQTTIAIRTELGLTETPIIAMTANAMAGDRERCLESGMNDYIPKPIDPDRLALTLAQWLERSGVIVSRRVEPMPEPAPPSAMARGNPAIFDRTAALRNLGGNEDLLRQLLGMFTEEHAHDAQLITEAFEAQDRRRIYSLSHSLKGAASTLGARRVAELSLALETGTRPDAEEIQLVTLKSKANALAHALAEAIEDMEISRRSVLAPETEAEAQAPPERQKALAAIDELTKLLLSGDADAEPGAQRLASLFAGAAPSTRAHAAAVRAAAERFDFDEAQSRLHRLRDDIWAGE
jgi:two-component system, sensor histidine kinase and response regulator